MKDASDQLSDDVLPGDLVLQKRGNGSYILLGVRSTGLEYIRPVCATSDKDAVRHVGTGRAARLWLDVEGRRTLMP